MAPVSAATVGGGLAPPRTWKSVPCLPRPAGGPAMTLVAMAFVALALGVLVYLVDRSGPRGPDWTVSLVGTRHEPRQLFGVVGWWLPTFAHTLAFSMFTAAVHSGRQRPSYVACAGWWLVNVAFEVGQHEKVAPVLDEILAQWFGSSGWIRRASGYFQHGTFDPGDIVAATAGAACAAMVICFSHRRGRV